MLSGNTAKATPALIRACLEKISQTNCIFSIQLWQDWLSLGTYLNRLTPEQRLNVPGSMDENFWRLQMPMPLEKLQQDSVNRSIKKINQFSNRL